MVINVEDSHIEWKILKVIEDKHVDDLLALKRELDNFMRVATDLNYDGEENLRSYYERALLNAASVLRNALEDDDLLVSFIEFCELVRSIH